MQSLHNKQHSTEAHQIGNLAACHGCIAVLMATAQMNNGQATFDELVEATDSIREGPGGEGFDLVDDGWDDGANPCVSMFKVPATLNGLRTFAESALKVCNDVDRVLTLERPAERR